MASHDLKALLLNPTSFFSLPLWLVILTFAGISAVLLSTLYLCRLFYYRRRSNPCFLLPVKRRPIICFKQYCHKTPFSVDSRELMLSSEKDVARPDQVQLVFSDEWLAGFASRARVPDAPAVRGADCCFTLKEIMLATNGFSDEIGRGTVGIVYGGELMKSFRVAVKHLMVPSCKEGEFVKEAEEIGTLRHKNVVRLVGYCVEATHRSLVHEYVENGNLHQWLHGSLGQSRPLSWKMRINIIHGIAKGLAYLHEDIESKIVHQGLKSSNILLDNRWNPRISDVALPRFLGPKVCATMAASGYVCQENAFAGEVNAENDVYSFGILIMEIVSGRLPIDHTEPKAYLVDWMKWMVANQKIVDVVDPKMTKQPPTLELKRVVLVALRCADSEISNRPKMGDIIYMLARHQDMLLIKDKFCLIKKETSPGSSRRVGNEKAARRNNCNPYHELRPLVNTVN